MLQYNLTFRGSSEITPDLISFNAAISGLPQKLEIVKPQSYRSLTVWLISQDASHGLTNPCPRRTEKWESCLPPQSDSGGSKGGLKVGGLRDPWYILYYGGAYVLYATFLHPNFGARKEMEWIRYVRALGSTG